ncbi:MAG: hypothetical protein OXC40_07860 [Proteobacteria bacterium]|nr:hypothetical protein [Pseudomonadota bacterium]
MQNYHRLKTWLFCSLCLSFVTCTPAPATFDDGRVQPTEPGESNAEVSALQTQINGMNQALKTFSDLLKERENELDAVECVTQEYRDGFGGDLTTCTQESLDNKIKSLKTQLTAICDINPNYKIQEFNIAEALLPAVSSLINGDGLNLDYLGEYSGARQQSISEYNQRQSENAREELQCRQNASQWLIASQEKMASEYRTVCYEVFKKPVCEENDDGDEDPGDENL